MKRLFTNETDRLKSDSASLLTVRRLGGVTALSLLAVASLAACEDASAAPTDCRTVEVFSGGIGQTVRDDLQARGLNPIELSGVADTISHVHDTLMDQHVKYSSIVGGDTFELCVTGEQVSAQTIQANES